MQPAAYIQSALSFVSARDKLKADILIGGDQAILGVTAALTACGLSASEIFEFFEDNAGTDFACRAETLVDHDQGNNRFVFPAPGKRLDDERPWMNWPSIKPSRGHKTA